MSISRMYNTSATTERESAVGDSTIKKVFVSYLGAFSCHIQPLDAALSESLQGGFGKEWIMFCAVLDIKSGDKVISDSVEYRVTGVEVFDFSREPHMEVTIRAFAQ